VTIKSYAPNHLVYNVNSGKGGIIVFSEICYPGWTATVDGKDVELGRANYVLRALNVSAGKHEVVLDFHPKSIKVTDTIAYVAYGILIALLIVLAFISYRKKDKQ
jgi:uncharacterized membrane protein YfhO